MNTNKTIKHRYSNGHQFNVAVKLNCSLTVSVTDPGPFGFSMHVSLWAEGRLTSQYSSLFGTLYPIITRQVKTSPKKCAVALHT